MEKDSAVRFLEACSECMDGARKRAGIGTLGEKTLHAVLKPVFRAAEGKSGSSRRALRGGYLQ